MEDHVVASSSAHDANANQRQPRKRIDKIAYSMPGQKIPRFSICDKYGPSLEQVLEPLARSLLEFDLELCRRVEKNISLKHSTSTEEPRKAEAILQVGEFMELNQQWKDINSAKHCFNHSYMTDTSFVPIWVEGLRIIGDTFRTDNTSSNHIHKQGVYAGILKRYEKLACNLRDYMVDTARQGLLEDKVFYSIQARWVRLDRTLDGYYNWCSRGTDPEESPTSRYAPKWIDVRNSVEQAKSQKDPVQGQLSGKRKPPPDIQPRAKGVILGSKIYGPSTLWLTMFGCAVISAACLALGFAHSPHLHGSAKDADFWFLIQTTIMQSLGLVVSALLERKRGNLPKWRWALPTVMAGICSIIATPLYLVLPTEWSSFLSLVAGATQTFMALQSLAS